VPKVPKTFQFTGNHHQQPPNNPLKMHISNIFFKAWTIKPHYMTQDESKLRAGKCRRMDSTHSRPMIFMEELIQVLQVTNGLLLGSSSDIKDSKLSLSLIQNTTAHTKQHIISSILLSQSSQTKTSHKVIAL